MKKSLFHFILFSFILVTQAQELTIKQKATIVRNMVDGPVLFGEGDVYGAINLYKEVLSISNDHPKALFRLTETYLRARDYKKAYNYALEIVNRKEEVKMDDYDAVMGLVYFNAEKLDSALLYFNNALDYKDLNKRYQIDSLITQVGRAKTMLKNAYDVKFTRLPRQINSAFMDYGVKLNKAGNKMYFTSRRPSGQGSLKNDCIGGDYNYYSDIFVSELDSSTGKWSVATTIDGKVNDKYFDDFLCFSPDETEMLIYRNDGCKMKVTGDIYRARQGKNGKWGSAKPLTDPKDKTVNHPMFFESGAVYSPDGNKLYFVSERKGGLGQSDIYVCTKDGANWSEPENLGANVNSPLRETAISISADGNTLYFSSQGHNSMGGYDVFMTKFENGAWTPAVNLGAPINSVRDDLHFYIAPDGTGYINTIQMVTYGSFDIYQLDLSQHPLFK